MNKKVLVSGCFDLLHSGHVAFLKEAAKLGDVHVCIGNDENIHQLKGRHTVNPENERHYMLQSLSCVSEVHINKGMGIMDFLKEMDDIKPDILLVNEDGATPFPLYHQFENRMSYTFSYRFGRWLVRSTLCFQTSFW